VDLCALNAIANVDNNRRVSKVKRLAMKDINEARSAKRSKRDVLIIGGRDRKSIVRPEMLWKAMGALKHSVGRSVGRGPDGSQGGHSEER
jgi:hypothetical protein